MGRFVDDYSFGITSAAGAIAETGTRILTDGSTPSRLAALATWVHVAVVRRENIYSDISTALDVHPNVLSHHPSIGGSCTSCDSIRWSNTVRQSVFRGMLPEILECDEYVNADAIAKALSPFESDRAAFRAGRVMLETIHDLADRNRDFAFETTMASRSFVPFLASCQDRGYEINLLFLWLRSIALAPGERRNFGEG